MISTHLQLLLGGTMVVYVAAMFAVSIYAQRRIKGTEDYLVAGRRLPLSLAWATLLATWFGAGTMLTMSGKVAQGGLREAALDPLGAGLCLILAGLFFAKPLWQMGLLTLSDFFRRKFGSAAEVISACIMVPGYFGWIAAQFVALAQMLELFFGMPPWIGILLVAAVGAGYTLLGGMWSVTLTDAVQITLILVGLVILSITVLSSVGDGSPGRGFDQLIANTPGEKLQWVPTEKAVQFWGWLGVLCAGALGNLPGQDLTQRIFASRSANVARGACLIAGVAYLAFGMLPVMLGLVAAWQFPESIGKSVLPAMARAFLHPAAAVMFVLVLMSAVLSTIDSAILSPASVMAQNLLGKVNTRFSSLALNRLCVVFVAVCSLGMAYAGQGAYELLEGAYELAMVGLFVPFALGVYARPRRGAPAIASMLVGCGAWLPQYLTDWDHFLEGLSPFDQWQLPLGLTCAALALVAYLACDLALRWLGPPAAKRESDSP